MFKSVNEFHLLFTYLFSALLMVVYSLKTRINNAEKALDILNVSGEKIIERCIHVYICVAKMIRKRFGAMVSGRQ